MDKQKTVKIKKSKSAKLKSLFNKFERRVGKRKAPKRFEEIIQKIKDKKGDLTKKDEENLELLRERFEIRNDIKNDEAWDLTLKGMNYCGPGTNVKENIVKGVKPTNEVDRACMNHDIGFSKARDFADQRKADERLVKDLNIIKNPTMSEKVLRVVVKNAIRAKMILEDIGALDETKFISPVLLSDEDVEKGVKKILEKKKEVSNIAMTTPIKKLKKKIGGVSKEMKILKKRIKDGEIKKLIDLTDDEVRLIEREFGDFPKSAIKTLVKANKEDLKRRFKKEEITKTRSDELTVHAGVADSSVFNRLMLARNGIKVEEEKASPPEKEEEEEEKKEDPEEEELQEPQEDPEEEEEEELLTTKENLIKNILLPFRKRVISLFSDDVNSSDMTPKQRDRFSTKLTNAINDASNEDVFFTDAEIEKMRQVIIRASLNMDKGPSVLINAINELDEIIEAKFEDEKGDEGDEGDEGDFGDFVGEGDEDDEGDEGDILKPGKLPRPLVPGSEEEKKGDIVEVPIQLGAGPRAPPRAVTQESEVLRLNKRTRDARPFFRVGGTDEITKTEEQDEQDTDVFANFDWVNKDGSFDVSPDNLGKNNLLVQMSNFHRNQIELDGADMGGLYVPKVPEPEFEPSRRTQFVQQLALLPTMPMSQKWMPLNLATQDQRQIPGPIKFYPQIPQQIQPVALRNSNRNRLFFPNLVDGVRT